MNHDTTARRTHEQHTGLVRNANLGVDAEHNLPFLEGVIERGRQTFIEVGTSLMEIRERRLYREQGWETFEQYCRERWGWTGSRSYQLMDAASVVSTIVDSGLPAPANEGQVRELARAPAELRQGIWQGVVEEHGDGVTAADVRDAVRRSVLADQEQMTVAELGDDMPPPPYIPPAEALMDQLTGVMIRALSTPIEAAVEGIGDGQLSDTDLLGRFEEWLSELAAALGREGTIRRIT